MKKVLLAVLVLLTSVNICFAFVPVEKVETEKAKIYLQPGQHLHGVHIDATGFAHGIEMNVPGTAYVTNVNVMNAGKGGINGRGILAHGPGVHIIVNGSLSINNSEDGFRAMNGAKMTILNSRAANNRRMGFFVGAGSSMYLNNTDSVNNEYGMMGVEEFVDITIEGSRFFENTRQGLNFWEGNDLTISNTTIRDNGVVEDHSIGIVLLGIKNAVIKDTKILNNPSKGVYASTDSIDIVTPSGKLEDPTRVLMERVTITGSPIAAYADGDSVITILNSTLEGSCEEVQDIAGGPIFGIITVDGKAVVNDVCP